MYAYCEDKRFIAIKKGLDQLNTEQLTKILAHIEKGNKLCVDNYNYDSKNDSWCPLAIGLGVPEIVKERKLKGLNNEIAKPIIIEIGESLLGKFSLNPLKGIKGDYFRENRLEDLAAMCKLIISERRKNA